MFATAPTCLSRKVTQEPVSDKAVAEIMGEGSQGKLTEKEYLAIVEVLGDMSWR